jgi:hypothetical protein
MHVAGQCRPRPRNVTPEMQPSKQNLHKMRPVPRFAFSVSRGVGAAHQGGLDRPAPCATGMLRTIPLRSRVVAKAKAPVARPPVSSRTRAPAPNPRLDLERRKVLQKHYRARHGVK